MYKFIYRIRTYKLCKKQLHPFSQCPPTQITTHIHPSHTRSTEGMATGNHGMGNGIRQTNGTHGFFGIRAGGICAEPLFQGGSFIGIEVGSEYGVLDGFLGDGADVDCHSFRI